MSRFRLNRAGSGNPYVPRMALQGLGQDEGDDLFDSLDEASGDLSDSTDTADTSAPTLTDADLSASGPDLNAAAAADGTYDPATGTVIQPGTATGIAAGIAALASGVSKIFGGGSAQLNATGITTESGDESSLAMWLLLAAGAGVLYMALQDRS